MNAILKKLKKHGALLAMVFCFTFAFQDAYATHFRYGNITWRETGNPGEIEFTIESAWRGSFGNFNPTVGAIFSLGSGTAFFNFGDGTFGTTLDIEVTSVNSSEDWLFGVSKVTHTYANPGDYTVFFQSCCRISTLENNANGEYRVEAVVNVGANNNPPTTSLQPIVNLPVGLTVANFNVPAVDSDGDPFTYRLATFAESENINPSGLTVNPNTGLVTWSTVGFSIGDLYSVAIAIEDAESKTVVDFIIKIVTSSTPPEFVYPPTPNNGSTIVVRPGENVNFTVEATDADGLGNPGGDVTINAVGQPTGSTFNPTLPTSIGNPISTVFDFTPGLSDVGTYVINFTAEDDLGIQTSTSVNLIVSSAPFFDVPPTPNSGSFFCLSDGDQFNQIYQASDFDPQDQVSIDVDALTTGIPVTSPTPPPTPGGGFPIMGTLPTSLSFSPGLPTTGGNPTSATYSGTVAAADWGIYFLEFVATDLLQETETVQNAFIIDRPPFFTTPEPTSDLVATVGVPFSITISADDPDVSLGDAVGFAEPSRPYVDVPSWLSFNDDGNGNLTLSGTPTQSDIGNDQPVRIEAHDRTTHFLHTHCTWIFQNFQIDVVDNNTACNIQLSAAISDASCNTDDGSIDLTITNPSGAAITSIMWDNGANTEDISGLAPGSYTVNVTDADGCTASAIYTVGVEATQALFVNCQSFTVALDANGSATISETDLVSSSGGGCGTTTISASPLNFTCSDLGTQNVLVTITDSNGQTATCTASVLVEDPTGNCPTGGGCTTPTNLAFEGTATHSSTYGLGVASFANDGNLDGNNPNWPADLQHTMNNDYQPWWQVDLGQMSEVTSIRIYNRNTTNSYLLGRLSNFWVFVSNDPLSTDLQTNIDNPNVIKYHFSGSAGLVVDIPLSGNGRYVQVQKTGSGPLHMAEVQVFGCELNQPQNMLPIADIYANNTGGTAPLTIAFDGSGSYDPDGSIAVYNWDFGDGNNANGATANHTYAQSGVYTVTLTVIDNNGGVASTSISITVDDPDPVSCSSPYNLAYNQSSSQSSTYGDGLANFAVDGNLTGDNPNGPKANLQHTQNGDSDPWWEVDLGQMSDVEQVKIYNRTTTSNYLLNRLNNFWVFISATPLSNSLQSNVNNPSITKHFFSGNAGSQEVISLIGQGRYVRIQKSGSGPMHMAEVQVFGCPAGSAVNQLPVAEFVANPTSGSAPLVVDFDASDSYDSDGTIMDYFWDFGDGNSGVGLTEQNTFNSAGDYTVTLTVVDNDGGSSTKTMIISVVNPSGGCASPSNLALGGSASQSSTYSNGVASLANDGDTVGDNPHNNANLQHTVDNESEPWWSVDLGQSSDVQYVTIYNRTTTSNYLLGRLKNFWVFISDQPLSGDLQTNINNANAQSYYFSGAAGAVEQIQLSGIGRYVQIQKAGSGPLHMAEVEVIGCTLSNSPIAVNKNQVQQLKTGLDSQFTSADLIEMQVAPNPFRGTSILTIKGAVSENAQIRVINILGKVVHTQRINGQSSVELGETLTAGTYWIQLLDNNRRQEIKVIKTSDY